MIGVTILNLIQIKHCERCQQLKPLMRASTNELHPIPVKPQVWSLVGIDLIGPLKKTSRGKRFILTMTCYFSKWVEAFALPDKSARSVAHILLLPWCS